MKERPILFSGAMVQKLLREEKTQTRVPIEPQPIMSTLEGNGMHLWASDMQEIVYPYEPGDRLWVREAWHAGKCADGLKPRDLAPRFWKVDNGGLWYPADGSEPEHAVTPKGKYRHARFMPRWASRITLEITGMCVERLRDITEAGAKAEGAEPVKMCEVRPSEYISGHVEACGFHMSYRQGFRDLWDSIHTKEHQWNDNPWLIVGGESGPGARPFNLAWARQTVRQCKAAGVACFTKQLGSKPKEGCFGYMCENDPRKGGDPADWPNELRVREFPGGAAA